MITGVGVTTDLQLLVPGGKTNENSLAVDLDDKGQALFRAYCGGVPSDRFFLYDHGQLVELNQSLGRNDVDFRALNNDGDLVGTTIVNGTAGEAFVYPRGQFKPLGFLPGLPQSVAVGINDHGRIVGWAGGENDASLSRQVIFHPHRISVIRHLPQSGNVIDINNRGEVLGTTFVAHGGKILTLPFTPAGFNNRGDVVGSVVDDVPPVFSHAMLFSNGKIGKLNDLIDPAQGWQLIYGFDINDRGQIVGWGRVNDHWAGFMLTPE